ncbi:MAG TPA: hypothetical protein VFU49_00190 [Ktedonobacteraceae bacterium]|nr:hypothetical protein [Ktedonobacteraceae bacterium]
MTTVNNAARPSATGTSTSMHVQADAELMKYDMASRAVDAEHRISVVQDTNGDPVIFSIGTPDFTNNNQSAFYVIMRQAGAPTGWQQFDLSSALGHAISAVAFEVWQNSQGQVTIALAIETPDKPGESQLYVTAPLTLNPTSIDWSNFHARWVARPTSRYPGLQITKILLGGSDVQGGLPLMIVATTQGGGNAAHYVVNMDTAQTDPTNLWTLFPLPNNTNGFIDLAIGRLSLGRGVYALYQVGPNLTLEFTTFKDQFGHGPYNVSLTPPPGTQTMFPLPGAHGYTDLYVAGDYGISVFHAWEQQSGLDAHPVVDAQAFPEAQGLTELIACSDTSKVAVWAIGRQEKLLYVTADTSTHPSWTHPTTLRSQVAQIAPLRHQEKLTNEIFLVGGDASLAYLWQDPVTTLWKESEIPLPDTNKVLTSTCYATHIHLDDQNGQPLINQTVNITASEWVYVTINGCSYELDSTHPIAIAPDVQGNITIINRVTTISTPIFHLQAAFLDHVIDVDPAAKIKSGLKQIKSGSDLKNARTRDGASSLLQGNHDDQTLDHCASTIQQLSTLMDTLPQDNPSPQARVSVKGPHVSLRAAHVASSNTINTAALPANYSWGVQTGTGSVTYISGDAVQAHVLDRYNATSGSSATSLTSIGDKIMAIGGDILEELGKGLKAAEGYFAVLEDDAVSFFVDLGNRIVKFALKFAAQVLSAINVILKDLLGIDLDKWLGWLGLLFNWNDIVVTHRVFVNLVRQMISYVEARLPDVENSVGSCFDELKARVAKLKPATGDTMSMKLKASAASTISSLSSELQEGFQFLTNSPGGNYGSYQLLHGGVGDFAGAVGTAASDALLAFLNDIALPALNSISQTAIQLFSDLGEAFQKDDLTPEQVFQKLGVDFILGALDVVKTVTVGLLKFLGDLIADAMTVIDGEIQIPIISALYEKFVGSKMSLLDGIALLFAIPATVGYKSIAHKAPFGDTTYGMDTRDANSLLSGLNFPPHPFSLQATTVPQETHARTLTKSNGVSGKSNQRVRRALAASSKVAAEPPASAQQGSDQPSSSQSNSNQASSCAIAYSQTGAFLELLTRAAGNGLGLARVYLQIQAKNTGNSDGLSAKLISLTWWQFGISLVSIASSFPVKSGPELTPQLIRWGFSFAEPIVLFTAARFEDQQIARKIIGQFEIAQAVINLILSIVISAIQMSDEGNDERTTDGLALGAALCDQIGLGLTGVANLMDEAKEVQWIPLLAAFLFFLVGTGIGATQVVVAIANERAVG